MKNSYFIFTFLLFMGVATAKATNPTEKTNPATETSPDIKSNVVVFKIIPTQSTVENPPSNTNTSGSLKKAGKVARTSYCHSDSLENIIYKKKGI